jgi:hypothetical protein
MIKRRLAAWLSSASGFQNLVARQYYLEALRAVLSDRVS